MSPLVGLVAAIAVAPAVYPAMRANHEHRRVLGYARDNTDIQRLPVRVRSPGAGCFR